MQEINDLSKVSFLVSDLAFDKELEFRWTGSNPTPEPAEFRDWADNNEYGPGRNETRKFRFSKIDSRAKTFKVKRVR